MADTTLRNPGTPGDIDFGGSELLVNGAVAGDAFAGSNAADVSLTDGAMLGDTFQALVEIALAEGFVSGDAFQAEATAYGSLAEGLIAGDAWEGLTGDGILDEGFITGDAFAAVVAYQANLAEGFVSGDKSNWEATVATTAIWSEGSLFGQGKAPFEVDATFQADWSDGFLGGESWLAVADMVGNLANGFIIADPWQGVTIVLPYVKLDNLTGKVARIKKPWGRQAKIANLTPAVSIIKSLGGKRPGVVNLSPSRSRIKNLVGKTGVHS